MATLVSIPLELLVEISSYLTTPDLGALRRSCKHVEKSLYEWFAKEFFEKKQFMLTHPSLQTLIDISQHASLSKKVKHIIITTDRFDASAGSHTFTTQQQYLRYCQGLADQRALLNTGMHREMLTAAFEALPNLETLGIRDFNSRSRRRDGNAQWTSYGATTVRQETGRALERKPGHEYVSLIFSSLLYASGRAQRTISHIEVLLHWPEAYLPDQAFNIPSFMLPTVEPVLRGLKTLLLNISPSSFPLDPTDRGGQQHAQLPDGWKSPWLRRFLAYTSNLVHLRVNCLNRHQFNASGYSGPSIKFLEWLAEPAGDGEVSNDVAPVALPHLQRLDLGMMSTTPNNIVALVAKFAPTLEAFCLWKVNLLLPPDAPLYPSSDRDLYSARMPSSLLKSLAAIPHLHLQQIELGRISNRGGYNVEFITGDPQQADTTLVKYVGKEGKKFLEETARFTEENEIKMIYNLEDESMSDDEDNEEEGEDDDDDDDDDDDEDEDQ